MPLRTCTLSTKETLQKELRGKDLQCHYYEAIVNATTDMIAITDGERIIDANKALLDFCDVINFDIYDENVFFASLFQAIPKFGYIYDGYQDRAWYEHVLKDHKNDCRVGIMKGQELLTFNLTLRPLESYENIYVMTLSDVTEMMGYKNVLEEGIKSSVKDREKTQFLLRQYDKAMEASTLVFKCDVHGIITYTNRSLCEVLFYGNGELNGQHFSVLQGKSISEDTYVTIWERVKKGKIYRGVLELTDKFGGSAYLDVTFVPIINQEKEIVEFFSLSHEITEVMRAKEAAIKTLEAKNKFFDQVSHELRTPLNAIINFTDQALESFDEILLDEESRDLVHMYIERSHKNSHHLLHLINSLLDMAKLQAGKEKYDMVVCDAVALVEEAYEATSVLCTKMEVDYLLELPTYLLFIQADTIKLHQCLTNLISNAIKFTNRGTIHLRVKKVNDECWIEVEDSGTGIPEAKLKTVFEPFEQVGINDQGTGLGLGIVHAYAEGMGMNLSVISTLGVGSCFTLKIKLERH